MTSTPRGTAYTWSRKAEFRARVWIWSRYGGTCGKEALHDYTWSCKACGSRRKHRYDEHVLVLTINHGFYAVTGCCWWWGACVCSFLFGVGCMSWIQNHFVCWYIFFLLFVAAGKSTFLRLLEESNPAYRVVSEPLTRWLNIPSSEDVSFPTVLKPHPYLVLSPGHSQICLWMMKKGGVLTRIG